MKILLPVIGTYVCAMLSVVLDDHMIKRNSKYADVTFYSMCGLTASAMTFTAILDSV